MPLVKRTKWQCRRRLLARWTAKSKPTEWMVAITGMVGVLATIIGVAVLVANGFFDQKKSELEAKKSELEAKKSELAMGNMKLEVDAKELVAKNLKLDQEIKEKEAEVKKAKEKANEYEKKLADTDAKYQEYLTHEKAVEYYGQVFKQIPGEKIHDMGIQCEIASDHKGTRIELKGLCVNPDFKGTNFLDVQLMPSKRGGEPVARLKDLRNLRALHIEYVKLTIADIEEINKLTNLKSLIIIKCELDDACISKLILPTTLRDLDISDNKCTVLPKHAGKPSLNSFRHAGMKIGEKELAKFLRSED